MKKEQKFFIGFIILLLLNLITIPYVLSNSIEDRCIWETELYHNNSLSKYQECINFYKNLTSVVYVNTTIIRNITQDVDIDTDDLATKSYVRNMMLDVDDVETFIDQRLVVRTDDWANDKFFENFITLPYMKEKYYNKEELDKKIEEYIKPISNKDKEILILKLKQNITNGGMSINDIKNLIQSELNTGNRLINSNIQPNFNSGNDNTKLYIFTGFGLFFLLGLGLFHEPTNQKIKNFMNKKPVVQDYSDYSPNLKNPELNLEKKQSYFNGDNHGR